MCQYCFGWILGPLISYMRVGAIFKINPKQNMSIFQRQNVNTLFAHVLFLREIDWQEVTQLFVCWWMINWGRNTKQGRNQSLLHLHANCKLSFCFCVHASLFWVMFKNQSFAACPTAALVCLCLLPVFSMVNWVFRKMSRTIWRVNIFGHMQICASSSDIRI